MAVKAPAPTIQELEDIERKKKELAAAEARLAARLATQPEKD